ncbi:MAG: class II fructose-bisphosphate aldolase [Candidatus Omnitrophica bacterium]|jgi:fructose/tagatose bisphosphate aldolase|nr:class II fructose-bisphosphate aldolase [Candidatus Omnitrophota bacterium]
MVYQNEAQIFDGKTLVEKDGKIEIKNPDFFRKKIVDDLIDTIILSDSNHLKRLCYFVAYNAGLAFGVIPSSIQGLYEARGKGAFSGFTVPAMNIRTLTYDLARAVYRAANKINAGAFIFEIAKSEIGYTGQRPLEYSSVLILAAIKENYTGPIFIQGDHFQVKAKNYLQDKDKELNPLKDLIKEAIDCSFYNIDIDTSTLVDLSKNNLDEQQKLNYEVCGQLTKHIRSLQPKNIDISIGGEIGEVGGKNSTPEELHAYIKGYLKEIKKLKGISKISIQTGTSHGGVVLPDGSIAKVSIDFDTLKKLSEIARKDYGLAGAVQHGASTLPNEAFHTFPEVGCAEIHLATQFQNIVYDYLPLPLKEKIYGWLHTTYAAEKKPDITNDQFIYKTRKNALGPFKKEIHSLPKEWREKISSILEEEFSFLFDKLRIKDTKNFVKEYVLPAIVEKKKEDFLKEEKDLGKLEGAD